VGCQAYVYRRRPEGCTDYPDTTCRDELPWCFDDGGHDVATLRATLEHSDVQNALAAGGLYGEDDRPVDGQVFALTVDDRTVMVGSDCRSSSCRPVPPGLGAAVVFLAELDQAMLMREPCASAFP